MVKLRGHHLICLHFFSGEGYDAAFIENLTNVLKRAEAGDITVCVEMDDICEKCPYCKGHTCEYNESSDKDIKEMDMMAMDLLGTEKGLKVRWEDVKGRIPGIFPQWYRVQCPECDWKLACEKNHYYKGLTK